MAEQTFRSPGFFPREVDLGIPTVGPIGIPAGVVGTALRGPAFVPVTVGSFADFENRFGGVDADKFGAFAVQQFLRFKTSCTFVRTLGGGSNAVASDFLNTELYGYVKNAGFKLAPAGAHHAGGAVPQGEIVNGAVQFIVAQHYISGATSARYPLFTQNNSYNRSITTIPGNETGINDMSGKVVSLVRGVLFTTTGSRFAIADWDGNLPTTVDDLERRPDFASPDPSNSDNACKLILSGGSTTFGMAPNGLKGVKVFSASLNPDNANYIAKILNTDPLKFQEKQHLLYVDFPVDADIATLTNRSGSIGLASGSAQATAAGASGQAFVDLFGRFDTRYSTPKTTYFKSQPFGLLEYDLFYFETTSDGAYANDKFKISIANLRAATDEKDPYGTFEVQLRKYDDTDINPKIVERFPNCNLNVLSDRFVGKVIGDMRESFNWDGRNETERRLTLTGEYANKSSLIRIVLSDNLKKGKVPNTALPFGFGGIPTLKTSDSLSHRADQTIGYGGKPLGSSTGEARRLFMSGAAGYGSTAIIGAPATSTGSLMTSSIVPPLPLRFKVTKGNTTQHPGWTGQAGADERVNSSYYWGVQNTRITSSAASNASEKLNGLVDAYSKFVGIEKLDALVTGTAASLFNSNGFTLTRVAFANELQSGHLTAMTGTAKEHMLEAAYIRGGHNAAWDKKNYTITDPTGSNKVRITMGTLLNSSSLKFNKFAEYAKFTNIFYGGFDGLNILDRDQFLMNDRASSTATGGKASTSYSDNGLSSQPAGSGEANSIIRAFRAGAKLLTDKFTSNINILAVPGIREQYVVDYVGDRVRDYGMAIYLMDLELFDENQNRLFNNENNKTPDVTETAEALDSRGIDNNYVTSYFPDVFINEPTSGEVLYIPSSIAALQALAQNDAVAKPWFAPAGFSRGALAGVTNTKVRLTATDRDTLYESRINPIATFPNSGFVIFGQKNLQLTQSALDRVNVRRMLLDVKRSVITIARRLLFEQNTAATRARFIAQVTPLLALVQAQQGIDKFRIIMDDTNNTQDDVLNNRLNGKIMIVPTRSVEFIEIDFIVDAAGVTFA